MADPLMSRRMMGRSLGAVATVMMATLIAVAGTPFVAPPGCGINWTRTGGVWIFTPDCSNQPTPAPTPPSDPPPGPVPPPP